MPLAILNMFSRLVTTVLYLAVFAIAACADVVSAQVLTPPERVAITESAKVHFEGVVSQRQKYSFQVKAKDRDYQVKLAPAAKLTLRLNKPNYDFLNRTVKVVRVIRSSDEETKTALAREPGRKSYQLPETLFVDAKFDQVRQMKRIMQAKVKRINNYVLMPTDPGAELPTEKSLRISGQLLPADEGAVALLKVNDEQLPVMLGHRGAKMTGFNILELKPHKTEVFVWGELGTDNVVTADRIEFQAIVTKLREPAE